jgi:hypothetical protein
MSFLNTYLVILKTLEWNFIYESKTLLNNPINQLVYFEFQNFIAYNEFISKCNCIIVFVIKLLTKTQILINKFKFMLFIISI